jgi:hypothetical protein
LLLEIAAILTVSLAIGGTGTSGARATAPSNVHQSSEIRLSDRPTGGTATAGRFTASAASVAAGPSSVDVDSLRQASGINLLAGLSQAGQADLSAFVARYPGQINAVLAAPPAASQVTGWWEKLPTATRASLAAATPRLVGNLDGIPLRERGAANLRYLGQSVADLKSQVKQTNDSGKRAALAGELAVLTEVTAAVRPTKNGPERSLVLLDTTRGGRAAIALGDPDTADYVSYLVPGMNYSVTDQIVNWSATADDLYREQKKVLRTLRALDSRSAPRTVATIAWIGYEAPDLFSVGGLDRAERGADFLEDSWLGIRSSRANDQPFISVFAHSYGTTVTLVALSRQSVELDALVMVGSPGSAVQSARKLPVSGGRVYVGEADWDPAVNSAFFGSDPGSRSYGAQTLGVSGARDRISGAWLHGSIGHNEYFKPGSESLHNMALIGTGNAKRVTNGSE